MNRNILVGSPGGNTHTPANLKYKSNLSNFGSALKLEDGFWGGMKPHLVAMGMLDEYRFHENLKSVVLGRNSAECNYTLLYSEISRRQCMLQWNGQEDVDTVTITSYSKIGIWVNLSKLPLHEPVVLHHRDEISFTPPELRGSRAPGLTWYFWYNKRWTHEGRQAAARPRTGYQVLNTLGEGTYGEVFRAFENATGRTVALKTVKKALWLKTTPRNEPGVLEAEDVLEDIMKEFELLRGIRHPNLIEYFGTATINIGMVLVMEIAEMDLDCWHTRFQNEHQRTTNETEVKEISQQICDGVQYLHARGIMHRDVKPGNLLTVTRSGTADHPDPMPTIKLTDFGTAKYIGHPSPEFRTMIGTPPFCAPEVILLREYGFSADSWGIAYTLIQLLMGKRMPNWNEFQVNFPKPIQWDYIIGECLRDTSWSSSSHKMEWFASFNDSSLSPVVIPIDLADHTLEPVGRAQRPNDPDQAHQVPGGISSYARYSDSGLLFLGGSEISRVPSYPDWVKMDKSSLITNQVLGKKSAIAKMRGTLHSAEPQAADGSIGVQLPTFRFPPILHLGHYVYRRRDDGQGMLVEHIPPS